MCHLVVALAVRGVGVLSHLVLVLLLEIIVKGHKITEVVLCATRFTDSLLDEQRALAALRSRHGSPRGCVLDRLESRLAPASDALPVVVPTLVPTPNLLSRVVRVLPTSKCTLLHRSGRVRHCSRSTWSRNRILHSVSCAATADVRRRSGCGVKGAHTEAEAMLSVTLPLDWHKPQLAAHDASRATNRVKALAHAIRVALQCANAAPTRRAGCTRGAGIEEVLGDERAKLWRLR
mmetsp:Transcript_21714/g.58477  ORF Transcript_21714/g.58477 Transcript_21714/m.58477 type:complete len:234 (+) Transcript_21714:632-1333(+)